MHMIVFTREIQVVTKHFVINTSSYVKSTNYLATICYFILFYTTNFTISLQSFTQYIESCIRS